MEGGGVSSSIGVWYGKAVICKTSVDVSKEMGLG